MDALNLYVVESVYRDIHACLGFHPLLKTLLIFPLYCDEPLDELRVADLELDLLKIFKVCDPLIDVSNYRADKLGKVRVAALQPASGRDTIGLVLYLSRVKLIKLGENRALE